MSHRVPGRDRDPSSRALAAWAPAEPPEEFADRVLAAERGAGVAPAPPRRARRRAGIAVAAIAAAALLALWAWPGAPAGPTSGTLAAAERRTARIGDRAVAVAEPESELTWMRRDGQVAVTQRRGDVFYRVEPGGAFAVDTPAGSIRVTGTCFRVEIDMNRQNLVYGGLGAALAAAVTVTVYEGGVIAETRTGTAAVPAGHEATLTADAPPEVRARREAGAPAVSDPVPSVPMLSDSELESASRDELVANGHRQAQKIDRLERELRALEARLSGDAAASEEGAPAPLKYFDFTQEELEWMAAGCQLRMDLPKNAITLAPEPLAPEVVDKLGLTGDELAAVNDVSTRGDYEFLEAMRDLYVEVTGNREVAASLSPRNLQDEIIDKSPRAEVERALEQLSHERAGLLEPPANPGERPPVERMLRLLASAGDNFERQLAERIGPERAREVRKLTLAQRVMIGCPDGDRRETNEQVER